MADKDKIKTYEDDDEQNAPGTESEPTTSPGEGVGPGGPAPQDPTNPGEGIGPGKTP